MADGTHACPHCARSPFADREALFSHMKVKHGMRAARVAVPEHPTVRREQERVARARACDRQHRDEPSLADLVIEASLARAMGESVDADLAEMFDV